jgi:hypothetical protein
VGLALVLALVLKETGTAAHRAPATVPTPATAGAQEAP